MQRVDRYMQDVDFYPIQNIQPITGDIYDTICTDIQKANRILKALVPEQMVFLFHENPELHLSMNDFVEKLKLHMLEHDFVLPVDFDFCEIVSAISTVYFYFAKHPQYQSFGV